MPARPIAYVPEAKDLGQSGLYAEIEVPGEYEVVLEDTDNYDKRAEEKSYGWVFKYSCETPSGGSVDFDLYLSHEGKSRWKLNQTLEAHGVVLEDGVRIEVDPNALIGSKVGALIDFPRDKMGVPTGDYRRIQKVFALPDLSLLGEPEEGSESDLGGDEETVAVTVEPGPTGPDEPAEI